MSAIVSAAASSPLHSIIRREVAALLPEGPETQQPDGVVFDVTAGNIFIFEGHGRWQRDDGRRSSGQGEPAAARASGQGKSTQALRGAWLVQRQGDIVQQAPKPLQVSAQGFGDMVTEPCWVIFAYCASVHLRASAY